MNPKEERAEDLKERLSIFVHVEQLYSSHFGEEAKRRVLEMALDFLYFNKIDIEKALIEYRYGLYSRYRPNTVSLLLVMKERGIGDYFYPNGEVREKYKNTTGRF